MNKVSIDHINEMHDSLTYSYARIGDSTVTVCCAFLPNGFQVATGESACVDPANYDEAVGQQIAKARAEEAAKHKLWELEGYLLKVTGSVSGERTTDMTFGDAVVAAKQGMAVARKGWNGAGMFAYIVPANAYQAQTRTARAFFGDEAKVPYREYWALKTAQGDVSTWAPSGSDSLAADWCVVDVATLVEG